jgi:hypothetical protein
MPIRRTFRWVPVAVAIVSLSVGSTATAGLVHRSVTSHDASSPTVASNPTLSSTPTPVAAPLSRADHSLAFDVKHGVAVLFGGNAHSISDANHSWLGDTWTWNGSTWENIAAVGPSPRGGSAFAYDPLDDSSVLFGGVTTFGAFPQSIDRVLSDTWRWTGSSWAQLAPAHSPPARARASMVFDQLHNGLLLFGGAGAQGHLSDLWLWSNSDWTQLPTTGSPPPFGAQLVPTSNGILALGNCTLGPRPTAVHTLVGSAWSTNTIVASEGGPVASCGVSVGTDKYGRAVTVGGTPGLGDGPAVGQLPGRTPRLTIVTISGWLDLTVPAGFAPREYGAATYDSVRQVLITFGGDAGAGGLLNDTWTWNGSTWSRMP